jgi:hypothetical protein
MLSVGAGECPQFDRRHVIGDEACKLLPLQPRTFMSAYGFWSCFCAPAVVVMVPVAAAYFSVHEGRFDWCMLVFCLVRLPLGSSGNASVCSCFFTFFLFLWCLSLTYCCFLPFLSSWSSTGSLDTASRRAAGAGRAAGSEGSPSRRRSAGAAAVGGIAAVKEGPWSHLA